MTLGNLVTFLTTSLEVIWPNAGLFNQSMEISQIDWFCLRKCKREKVFLKLILLKAKTNQTFCFKVVKVFTTQNSFVKTKKKYLQP
jgi:hypothetical protein